MKTASVTIARIENRILLIRGQKVLLDTDLAELYGVPTKVLVQAVKRNLERFPEDFMLQLTDAEFSFEVTICDLKARARWPALRAIRFHRAGSGHALVSALQSPSHRRQH